MPTLPPVAEEFYQPKEGWGRPPMWRKGQGWTAERAFRVYAEAPELVMLAGNIPPPGSAYSSDWKALTVAGIEPTHQGGKNYFLKVMYEQEQFVAGGGSQPLAEELPEETTFSLLKPSSDSITAMAPVNDDGVVQQVDRLINNGNGMPVLVGIIEFEVHRYYKKNEEPDLLRLIDLQVNKATNKTTTLLPPLRFWSGRLSFPAGQLLYSGFTPNTSPSGVPVIVHQLRAAYSHKFKWDQTDEDGKVKETFLEQRYRAVDFSDLWPEGKPPPPPMKYNF